MGMEIQLPRAVTLRAGRSAVLRPIRVDDKDEFEAAFGRLSANSRYTRFFAPVRELPEKALDKVTHPAPDGEVQLVALGGEGIAPPIVAGGRLVWAPGSDTCEFAVTVADDWQGVGLARQLMETLIAIARDRGLRRMEGFVLPENTGMRGLAGRLGFADTQCPNDRMLRLVSLDL
jgi:GNAT superfamily N-acetyltransferase